ncbi:hypothetical protein A9Q81_01300 [Gammaproteobacteria bacterium 42_54_T18]|nr:hypothetical protein A9Q81_01300 [Gammaproteobacteria bacterium 42_54_T18]
MYTFKNCLPLLTISALSLGGCGGSSSFTQQTNVFGVTIKATAATPTEKVLHAANILAEYLDNNEDGIADNTAVVERLKNQKATLLMAKNAADMPKNAYLTHGDSGQDLYAAETHINGAAQGKFDASLEEILHLITHVGYASVYPGVFGEEAGSAIADAMDTARGGHFTSIPKPYPTGAWYTYDDTTCSYSCMVTEYTYWALTSILGAQSYSGRLESIQHEWKLNTNEKVMNQDTAVYTILTDAQYALATNLPDGKYAAGTFEIINTTSSVATLPTKSTK